VTARSNSRRSKPRIQSLARADAILETIFTKGSATLTDISIATGLGKTTAYYMVETLSDLGFVERLPEGGYTLGLRNVELGLAVQRRRDIPGICRPALIRLCSTSKETVNLALPFVFDCMIVESLEGSYGVRATSYAGSRAHYHSSACGKAILAFMPAEVRETLYSVRPFISMTPNTITDKAVLERELGDVRKRGFATDIEENELGAHCAAAPIRDRGGDVIGAISISGLASRFPKSQLKDVASLIITEAEKLSGLLGGRGPSSPVKA